MDKAIGYERTELDHEIILEFEEEYLEDYEDEEEEIGTISGPPSKKRLYAQSAGGLLAIAALFILPFLTLPGMFIVTLIGEIYLWDWTYSKISYLYNSRSFSSRRITASSLEDELDREKIRAGPRYEYFK